MFRSRLLKALALLFAAATTLYSGIWMYGVRQQPEAYLGVVYEPWAEATGLRLLEVGKDCPAERAGLRPGDLIRPSTGSPQSAAARFAGHWTGTASEGGSVSTCSEGRARS